MPMRHRIIPRLSIVQPTTPDAAPEQIGKLRTNMGEVWESATFIVLRQSRSRVLFPTTYNRNNEPLCRSHNGIVPANDIEGATPMHSSCEVDPANPKKFLCQYANWGMEKGKAVPPRCSEVYNLLLLERASYQPMWWSAKNTSFGPVIALLNSIARLKTTKQRTSQDRLAREIGLWSFATEMTVNRVINDSGTFYVPKFGEIQFLDEQENQVIMGILAQLHAIKAEGGADASFDPPVANTPDDQF
jgi:hypothetical protein